MIERTTGLIQIDYQARAWQKKLIACWPAGCCPRLYPDKDRRILRAFLSHEMTGPLPDDRLDLIYAATRREEPSREAFVTLALVDYIEDLETLPTGERSAKLPYQLAWARTGRTLGDHTGLPGGIARALWPEVIV